MEAVECPAILNYLDERAIILFMRSLLDLHDLLLLGWEKEMSNLRKSLKDVGWGNNKIEEFLQKACENTRYEQLIPSMKFGERKF